MILTIFPYFAIYSEPLYATYASFGGGESQYMLSGIATMAQLKRHGHDIVCDKT